MDLRLPEPPSIYFHRQFYPTFKDNRADMLTRELMGVGNLMWGSDYPHTEGVWPFSRQQVANNFSATPEDDTRKVMHNNGVNLYGFPAEESNRGGETGGGGGGGGGG